ncbi:c-type cytochrome biogenesis protein CcmI [Acuticoccus kandeliae]|uniref:c-type cytochrome biogenesis protein CcmI n=1 Tax=Acuticoccus kandeliae TaxID=2073160 RepID=UPI000D3E8358|nr:c-type cytochrome biogenesis protein CcmI [Acuticoccus kandeliae]
MILWFALAALLALTLVVLVRPLVGADPHLAGNDDADVYAAQLDEVEADRERGLISAEDAASARTEIARRLLRARRDGGARPEGRRRRWGAAGIVGAFVIAFSVAAYGWIGSPTYGDQPLAARTPPETNDLATMLARAEERLAAQPDDGRGWAAVAPVYLRMGRFDDAAEAYANAGRTLGESAAFLTGEGQALTLANDGAITDTARARFARASEIEPAAPAPQIFLAIDARQRGDIADAANRWRTLLETSNGSEPWLPIARAEIAQLPGSPLADIAPPAAAPAPGPTPEAVAAASAMSDEQRAQMIEGMVSGLAARLDADGGTAAEWIRLVNAYRVLGREADAAAAIERAMAALPDADRAAFAEAVNTNKSVE